MFSNISVDDSLRILDQVDRGELKPTSIQINGGPDSRIQFKGNLLEPIVLLGMKPGVALDGSKGGVLVRRGHATSKRFVMDANGILNFYWITEAGREAVFVARQET